MKPSSKNEVMNGIVNAYIAQKVMDKANNTHYADTWKILNGADDEIDASLKFDLSEVEWDSVKSYLKANNIAFTLCLISYKDGHSQNSFVWYDNEHIYATEMNEIGSVTFHVVDNANKEAIKPTDETSSSILKMLLALENGGANGGGGEVTTKQVFKGGVDILDKPLDVKSKATFSADVNVNRNLIVNSAANIKDKSLTSADAGKVLTVNEDGSLSWQQKGAGGGMKAFFDAGGKCQGSRATSFEGIISFGDTADLEFFNEVFANCKYLSSIPLLDTSKVTEMNKTFSECPKLSSIPAFNLSKVITMQLTFEGCVALKSIPAFDASNIIGFYNTFQGCYNLETIHMINIGANLDISPSTKFTREALLEIIGNLKTVTSTMTLTMGATNLAKLTEEDKAIATNKGWTLA